MTPEPGSALDQGIRHLQANDLQAAIEYLQQAVREDPSNGRAYGYLGIAQSQLGDLAAGVASLEEAARLQPEDAGAHYNLGVALTQAQRLSEARAALQRALALDPNHSRARGALESLGPGDISPQPAALAEPAPAAAPGAGMQYTPPPPTLGTVDAYAPPAGRRIARGLGWGALYAQWWTIWIVFWQFVWSGLGSKNDVNLPLGTILILVLALALFLALVGSVVGLIIGAANAPPEHGAIIGVVAGILLLGVEFFVFRSGSVLINIFFWFFTGRYVGALVAARVQQPVAR